MQSAEGLGRFQKDLQTDDKKNQNGKKKKRGKKVEIRGIFYRFAREDCCRVACCLGYTRFEYIGTKESTGHDSSEDEPHA